MLRTFFAFLLFVAAFACLHQEARAAGLLPQFLIVDYHPLSKQAAAGTNGQYDYVYRVDVRNAGAAVADVGGSAQARLPFLALPDNAVSFGAVGAFRTKASTDTITVRAGRYFDRRLDKKVQVNGRWRYQDEGSDDADRSIPGLPAGADNWSDDFADWYYAIKFQFLFQWTFSVRADTEAPLIGTLLPAGPSADATPTIGASYQDGPGGGGIDTRKLMLVLDGVNVTPGASVTGSALSYTPTRALQDGVHAATV